MIDSQIRSIFHKKYLSREHSDPDTLILDELGLDHGRCIADIVVVKRQFEGYEIKSDRDSLKRLNNQIQIYNSVFEFSSIIVTTSHYEKVISIIPDWWGTYIATENYFGQIEIVQLRKAKINEKIDDFSVAKLLWKNEAIEILTNLGFRGSCLKQNRLNLYKLIIDNMNANDFRSLVRHYLKKREMWRLRELQVQYDG